MNRITELRNKLYAAQRAAVDLIETGITLQSGREYYSPQEYRLIKDSLDRDYEGTNNTISILEEELKTLLLSRKGGE